VHLGIFISAINQLDAQNFCFTVSLFRASTCFQSRSQWPRGLRRTCRSAAACLLRSWVRIPPGAWISVSRECYELSGRGLCDELITRPEESYWLWCVVEYDVETSWMRRPWPTGGLSRHVLIIRRSKLHYTSSGIITPIGGRIVHRLREDCRGMK